MAVRDFIAWRGPHALQLSWHHCTLRLSPAMAITVNAEVVTWGICDLHAAETPTCGTAVHVGPRCGHKGERVRASSLGGCTGCPPTSLLCFLLPSPNFVHYCSPQTWWLAVTLTQQLSPCMFPVQEALSRLIPHRKQWLCFYWGQSRPRGDKCFPKVPQPRGAVWG